MCTHLAQDDTLIFSIYIGWADLFWVNLLNFNIFGVSVNMTIFAVGDFLWLFFGSLLILIILMG